MKQRVNRYLCLAGMMAALFNAQVCLADVQMQVEQLEDVVVTANKTEQNVQNVAVSTTVFTATMIDDLKIESMNDVAAHTTNFMLYQTDTSGSASPAIRGIYADWHTYTVSSGIYVDGVPVLEGTSFDQVMMDVERIEVLKGPQGTLYGKSSEAGVINIITRKPDNDFTGKVTGELGNDGRVKAGVSLSTPIKENLAYLGVSAFHDQRDGWVKDMKTGNTVDDISHDYGRGIFRFTPSDSLDISLQASLVRYDDGQSHLGLTDAGATAYGVPELPGRMVNPDFVGKYETDVSTQSLKVDSDITPGLALTSVTVRRDIDKVVAVDYDCSPGTVVHWFEDTRLDSLSQELRLAYTSDRIQWVTGAYADNEEYATDTVTMMAAGSMPGSQKIEGRSGSLFSHATVTFLEKWSVLAGLRYDYQEKEFTVPGTSHENDWNEISPKLGLQYRFSPQTMVYSTVAKGYLPGGFNIYTADPDRMDYDAETLWSYEIGIKNKLMNNRLILNAALYHMDINDVQVRETDGLNNVWTSNGAKATGKGGEIDITFIPFQGLHLFSGFGYSDVEFDEFSDAAGNYSGNQKNYSPEYTFRLGGIFRHDSGFYLGGDITGVGDMYMDKANLLKRDAYALVNAKVGYEKESFDIYAYGRNIFDETYDSVPRGTHINYSPPAEFGIQAVWRF